MEQENVNLRTGETLLCTKYKQNNFEGGRQLSGHNSVVIAQWS